MGNKMLMGVAGLILMVLIVTASSGTAVSAVWDGEDEYEYCYGTQCGTQAYAMGLMEAAHPDYAGKFELKKPNVGKQPGKLRPTDLVYSVPDEEPNPPSPAVYGADFGNPAPEYCAASGDPIYPRFCKSEEEFIAGFVNWYANIYGASRVEKTLGGTYMEPFSETVGFGTPVDGQPPRGITRHNHDADGKVQRYVQTIIHNPDGSIAYGLGGSAQILKFTSYTCAKGFAFKTGVHPNYLPNTPAASQMTTPMCHATVADQVIATRLRQSKSCPANDNPCYPVTGDKARFETDFEFAGKPFVRSYHSLGQAGQWPELAPGWVHSYSDRVIGTAGAPELTLITEQGYIEMFTRVGTTARYVSSDSSQHVLDVQADNGFKWLGSTGETRTYSAQGRLLRMETPAAGTVMDLTYDGDRLIEVTDNVGRKLIFDYAQGRVSAIHLPGGDTVTYAYDSDRNLQSATHADGRTRVYHYNEAGYSDANDRHALTGITGEDGKRYATFGYDSKGRVRLSQLHSASGPVDKTELSYSGNSQVTVNKASGEVEKYTLSSSSGQRQVTAIITPANAGTATTTYAGTMPKDVQDKAGNITRYEYATDGATLLARYDAYGTPQERKTVYTRDSGYRTVSEELFEKSATGYVSRRLLTRTYDYDSNVESMTVKDMATGEARTIRYDYCLRTEWQNGHCPMFFRLLSVDGPRAGSADKVTYEYYNNSPTGCSASTSGCPYQLGQIKSVTNGAGQKTQYLAYNAYDLPSTIKRPNGVMVDIEYDRYRVTAAKVRGSNDASESDDRITRVEYDPNGLVTKLIQPDGVFASFQYDDARRLTGITDSEGNQLLFTLDGAGNRAKEEVRDNGGTLRYTLSRTYNALDQLQALTDAYGRSTGFTYDPNGYSDQMTDALTRVTDNNRDPLNRLIRNLQDVNGVAAETTFKYDVFDNLTQVIDPKGLNTSYTYNAFGELTRLISPDTGTTTHVYDSAGNRTSQTDARGTQTLYAYDVLNRVTTVSYPQDASLNIVYQYDAAQADCMADEAFLTGLLSKMTDNSGSTTYCYNRFGQLTRKVQRTQGKTLTQRWQYAANGRLQAMTYPDGAVVDYVYNVHGRVTEIGVTNGQYGRQVLLNNLVYYPFGPVAQWTYGNGRVLTRTYNRNYQPGIVQDTAAGGLSLDYEFDEVGNLKRVRNGDQADPPARVFGYDGLNRLTEAKDGANVLLQSYSYDKTGNRLAAGRLEVSQGQNCSNVPPGGNCTPAAPTSQWKSSTYGYLPNNHRLWTLGTTQRSYDAAGNLISTGPMQQNGFEDPPPGDTESAAYGGTVQTIGGDDGSETPPGVETRTYSYNAANRMSSVSRNGELLMTYRYNGVGERVYRSGNGDAVHTVFDPAGHWLGDYDANGTTIQQVIWLGDLPVGLLARIGGVTQLHYIEADMLGTPRVVIEPVRDTLGKVVWRWDLASEAFGDDAPSEDPDGNGNAFVLDMRFPGQQYDSASKLNYNYFRDYEAATGRYAESDPIGLGGGITTYAYTGSRPGTIVDTYGLEGTCPVGPSYTPTLWNDGGTIQNSTNCYSYAWNRTTTPVDGRQPEDSTKPQPGEWSGWRYEARTCGSIKAAAIRDGMTKPDSSGNCPKCSYKVFLVIDPKVDYHWYRQDADGTWSHKPGHGPATNLDASGNLIFDPSTADRNYPGASPRVNYRTKCGYLCVPNH